MECLGILLFIVCPLSLSRCAHSIRHTLRGTSGQYAKKDPDDCAPPLLLLVTPPSTNDTPRGTKEKECLSLAAPPQVSPLRLPLPRSLEPPAAGASTRIHHSYCPMNASQSAVPAALATLRPASKPAVRLLASNTTINSVDAAPVTTISEISALTQFLYRLYVFSYDLLLILGFI